MAPELVKSGTTSLIKKLAGDAMTICKALVIPRGRVETLLMSDRAVVSKYEAEDAVVAAGKPYEDLVEVHMQMSMTLKRLKKEENKDKHAIIMPIKAVVKKKGKN